MVETQSNWDPEMASNKKTIDTNYLFFMGSFDRNTRILYGKTFKDFNWIVSNIIQKRKYVKHVVGLNII